MQELWTIKRILDWTTEFFQQKSVPEPRLSAELLLAQVLQCRRIDLYLQFERILTGKELEIFRSYVKRRARHEPVQYITGEAEFMGLKFRVTPQVLIPRPETELLVEKVLEALQAQAWEAPRILDVGSGSGCIALSLGHFLPRSQIVAVDISPAAIAVARENARRLGVETVEFVQQDALEMTPEQWEPFHLIVSNPPYVGRQEEDLLHPQVKDFEPREALFAGETGLEFYRAFLPRAYRLLYPGGLLFLEIGFRQQEKIFQLLTQQKFTDIQFYTDYQNIERIVKAEK